MSRGWSVSRHHQYRQQCVLQRFRCSRGMDIALAIRSRRERWPTLLNAIKRDVLTRAGE